MAVIRTGTIQQPRKRKLLPDFIAPNLLLTVLAVTAVTDMRRPAIVSPQPRTVRRVIDTYQPPNLLLIPAIGSGAAEPGEETLRPPILQGQSQRQRRFDPYAPPNLLLTTLAAAPEPPAETTLRAPILQSGQRRVRAFSQQIYVRREAPEEIVPTEPPPFTGKTPILENAPRGHRRIRFVNYSLNLAIGEVVTGEETLRAPILQSQPRRMRSRTAQIYVRPGGEAAAPAEPLGELLIKRNQDYRPPRKSYPRFVNYSLNLAIGAVPAINNPDWSIQRRTRQPLPQFDTPNLLFSTLFVTPIDPFKPSRMEQASATRRRRPLPVESEGINNEIRGGGIMPFDPKLRYFDAATRRRQPLPVESYGINASRLVPEFPKVASLDERQQIRGRRDQDANTFLKSHNFALVEADRHFKYDWTITRGKRPNPQEPDFRNFVILQPVEPPLKPFDWTVTRGRRQHPEEPIFRNYLTLQPVAPPFESWRTEQAPPPRRGRFSDRPTFDLNFLLPRFVAIKPIGVQYHDPSPHARQSVARYTFLHPLQLQLIGQDRFFYGPGRGPFNYDWSIKLRYRYPERASLNDFQRGVPIGTQDFNPSSPGLEYDTFLEQLDYRSKPDRLHFSSLKDRLHYRIPDEDT